MKRRRLGTQGLEVSEVGLGCMGMSAMYADPGGSDSEATIFRALDLGVTLFDTADVYGPRTNEVLLGKTLGTRRNEAIIATKFGFVASERVVDGRPEYVVEACNASLERLGIDHIDLYYQHRVDPQVPIEDTVGAMAGLVEAGKVRYIGICEASPETIRRAHAVHPLSAVQTEYSLWTREPEDEVFGLLQSLDIGLVCYSPIGRGFLSGQIRSLDDLAPDDWRREVPRFGQRNIEVNLELVRRLTVIAGGLGVSPATLAVAWLLSRGQNVVPIPGTKREEYLVQNCAAGDLALTADSLQELDQIFAKGIASGDRYPDGDLSLVDI
ncbi:aldo/keto reductase [Mycobacterium sp. CBMA293]|uniref:aldo/keto reductase n=1 Tax=unclassified Mycolicibacterium TaxID=2636767 RepID=UPI0012DC476C|nr:MULTISPECIES: aldo/keto reductase [unclassified Mycolicibacterium]MUL49406.1 aldo/keto reductase [Mycolicibacterium sp. CBMA 360]MUL62582.1 aldo/keto reductase [Mycolicibacterium sp. CBMA 335]MUL69034.1 aldo/keto reductase [Mycolicibacterium sp. CBMA 311]MUL96973.1 aldo/keto reductase [Mycolicibacterium sp. CBMA 230]MUM03989.1 aldo/keto reductase [Mycolicibacterium sp. CBMA 213]